MRRWTIPALLALAVAACGGDSDDSTSTAPDSSTTAAAPATTADTAATTEPSDDASDAGTDNTTSTTAVPVPATTLPPTTVPATTTTTPPTTTSTTTTTTTTLPPVPDVPGPLDLSAEVVALGASVEGRPIYAERYGVLGGRRVLVIGVIHGNEDDGLMIVDELRNRTVPDGVELWLVDSMNPDGVVAQDRHNANEVDLNRNFPHNWGPIGQPGDSQYAGPSPASEPETQAAVNFISQLRPDIAIWYHQDAFLVIPSSGRDGRIRARYAELTGLPLAECCGTGGIYTGIAATWANNELAAEDAVPFIVELGGTTSPAEVVRHADAVLTIAVEG